MNSELSLLVKDIPTDDLEIFTKSTKASTTVKKIINKVTVDYSWVDVVDEAIPALDSIIRNPRRFITNEEDVIIIEKTKKVTQEAIKHLATHTQLIQSIDKDENVKPSKLLNVFKEETIDLYENRFIYSLIKNLNMFLREQLTYKEESSENKEEKSLKYEATTNYHNQDVTIKLDLSCNNREEIHEAEEVLAEREAKIKHITDIVASFMTTKFMKEMANATPVKSPIQKTNIILKDRNFIKARELWEFLERYQAQRPVKEEHFETELTNSKFKRDFGLTYFINYNILTENFSKEGNIALTDQIDLPKTAFEQAKKFDIDENDLRKKINEEIFKAKKYKEEQKTGVINAYKAFISAHYSKMNKSVILFK